MKQKFSFPTDLELIGTFKKEHPNLLFNGNKFWDYDNGVYGSVEDEKVRKFFLEVLRSSVENEHMITAKKISALFNLAKSDLVISGQIFDQNNDVIVFKNGVLNLNTLRLAKHSPKYRATIRLDYDYDNYAKCPNFLSLFSRFDPKVVSLLQEFAGHCISNDPNRETTLWLYGNPGSGKSTFLEGLKTAFKKYMAVINPTDFHENPYFLSTLVGIRALCALETPTNALKDTAMYNSLVSEEEQVVHKKYADDYRHRFNFRIFLTMNILPPVFHQQDGLWRRLQIIRFPDLPESERDRTLKKKIMEEAPGIMAWALMGLRRLRRRGDFDIPESVKREKENYKRNQPTFRQFLEETSLYWQRNEVQASELQRAAQQFYLDHGQTTPTPQEISAEMMKYARKRQVHGTNYYTDISLN